MGQLVDPAVATDIFRIEPNTLDSLKAMVPGNPNAVLVSVLRSPKFSLPFWEEAVAANAS